MYDKKAKHYYVLTGFFLTNIIIIEYTRFHNTFQQNSVYAVLNN